MARPSKYPLELRQRAVRMVIESKADYPSEFEAIRSVSAKLGIGTGGVAVSLVAEGGGR